MTLDLRDVGAILSCGFKAGYAAALDKLPDECLNDVNLIIENQIPGHYNKPCDPDGDHSWMCPQAWRKGGGE